MEKEINENDNLDNEIKEICPEEIKISNCKKLYDILEGDKYVKEELDNGQTDENKDNNIINKKDITDNNPDEVVNEEEDQNNDDRGWGVD